MNPAKRGGEAKLFNNPLPIIQLKKFLTTPGPPPPFNYILIQGLPELGLHESNLKFVLDEKRSMILKKTAKKK